MTGKSKKEVRKDIRDAQDRAASDGEDPYRLPEEYEDLLVEYLHFLHDVDDSINRDNTRTYNNRRSNLAAWFKWCDETGRDVRDIEEKDLTAHLDDIYDELSGPSIGARISSMHVFYLWGVKRPEISGFESDPMEDFDLEDDYGKDIKRDVPKQILVLRAGGEDDDENDIIAIPPETTKQLVDNPGNPTLRNRLIIELLAQTGVRVSELAGVRIGPNPTTEDWETNNLGDLNIEDCSMWVTTSKTDAGDTNHRREVFFEESLKYDLYKWIFGARDAHQKNPDSPYLLRTTHKGQMRPSHLSRIVKEAAQRAGVNEVLYKDAAGKKRWLITGHTLRHSFASYRANKTDMKLHILAKLMGHRKLDTTRKYISRSRKEEKRQARQAISDWEESVRQS